MCDPLALDKRAQSLLKDNAVTNEVVRSIDLYFSSQAQAQAAANSFSYLAGH
jgi:hypothetical protein